MLDECPMTEECPGYDRDRRVCLLRPADCEFAPDASSVLAVDADHGLEGRPDAELPEGDG